LLAFAASMAHCCSEWLISGGIGIARLTAWPYGLAFAFPGAVCADRRPAGDADSATEGMSSSALPRAFRGKFVRLTNHSAVDRPHFSSGLFPKSWRVRSSRPIETGLAWTMIAITGDLIDGTLDGAAGPI
jgi:hypothetical protein